MTVQDATARVNDPAEAAAAPPPPPPEAPPADPTERARDTLATAGAPVLRTVAEAVDGARDAITIDEGVGKLNSDGDALYLRATAEGKGKLQIGLKGQYGGDLTIRQNGEGTDASYTVAVEKHALAALTGQISIPNLPIKAEAGVQTFDVVEMTFDTKEEAARAGKLIQRLAAADAVTDPLAAASGAALPAAGGTGSNPLANPLNGDGAPADLAQDLAGIGAADRAFLSGNITAYEQTVTGRGRLALEGKLPLPIAPGELGVEGRLDGRQILTRRVELPSDAEDGALTYTLAQDVRLSAKEKALLGPVVANQVAVGATAQNRVELARGRQEVSVTYDIPAGTDPTASPVGGRPVPEIDLARAGDLGVPDAVEMRTSAEWSDQSLLNPTRVDVNRASVTYRAEDPAGALDATKAFLRGDPAAAAAAIDATALAEVESVRRTGVDVQLGAKGQIGEGNKLEGSVILTAGLDDVIGRRTITLDPAAAGARTPADAPALPTDPVLAVLPKEGVAVRDAPDGTRTGVIRHGTFVAPDGETVKDAKGLDWQPVKGVDPQGHTVEGFVRADLLAGANPARGAMDAAGRASPALEAQGFKAVEAKEGDTLWDIAGREGADPAELIALNDEHLRAPGLIFPGDKVYVPGTAGPAQDAPAPDPATSVRVEETGETRIDGTGSLVKPEAGLVVPGAASKLGAEGTASGPPAPGETGVDPAPGVTASTADTPAKAPAPDAADEAQPPAEPAADGATSTGWTPDPGAPVPPPAPVTRSEPVPTPETDRPDLDEVLTGYQVDGEERGTWRPKVAFGVEVPGWADGVAGRELTMPFPPREGRALDELSLLEVREWGQITDATGKDAMALVPAPDGVDPMSREWQNDGHVDAARHALWNARMTQAFGEDWTAEYATAHEGVIGNEPAREAMDLYNNEVGRRIAVENPGASDAELQALVVDALRDGELVVLDADGDLAWSDRVETGAHGQARPGDLPGAARWNRDQDTGS